MPEAVIVAAKRSPIGRANKGSLVGFRPDDLAALMVQEALDAVPGLDPRRIDDLILGCGMPGGEQGMNMARIVAVKLGYDFLPGTTVNRYCSSSLQTTRMAFHAIKAGEGDAFVSAGVESVTRFAHGSADYIPEPGPARDPEPGVRRRGARTNAAGRAGRRRGTTRARTALLPDAYIAMGQTAENVAGLHGREPRAAGRVRGPQPEPGRGGDRGRASSSARSRRSRTPDGRVDRRPTTARAPA